MSYILFVLQSTITGILGDSFWTEFNFKVCPDDYSNENLKRKCA